MKSDKELDKILTDIYRELYINSEPHGDWDVLVESDEENFFMNYTIDENIYNDIVEKHLNNKKLSQYEKLKIRNTVTLGCSPCFTKK